MASPFVGVGACGANRMYYNAETMPETPYHYQFYKYVDLVLLSWSKVLSRVVSIQIQPPVLFD
jgi:hypothetical protein